MFRKISILVFFTGIIGPAFSQTVLTVEEAVTRAIATNRDVAAANLSIIQQKQLVKSAINLPNPEFFWESPTGSFYTGSITQSFEFPTVYGKQVQLQKQQVIIAEKDQLRTQIDVAYRVRLLYLAIQYTAALLHDLKLQDSAFYQLQVSAQRQFDAGQIDYLQKAFTENEYGEIHNQLLQTSTTLSSLAEQLKYLTYTKEAIAVTALQLLSVPEGLLTTADTSLVNDNPTISLLQQEIEVNRKNLELQKNKALPGLAFGYFNQGERNTPTSLRF
ncbi:MAG TPA: TolC family protein, partial [Chitinophagaceae bacterium]|nr:TolC family protein [Chitinophagaceae bacterium]